jgi:hypothetical protein
MRCHGGPESQPALNDLAPPSGASRGAVAAVFAASFLLLLATRWEVLGFPPSADQAGIAVEANFLYETGFDYQALRSQTPLDQGGAARAYVTALPTALLALFRVAGCTVAQSFALYHAFVFACASAVAAIFFRLVSVRCGSTIALAATAAMALNPLLTAQADLITLDLPMIVFAVLAALAVQRRRWGWALAATFAGFWMKNSAVVVTAAVVATLAFLLLIEWRKLDRRRRFSMAGWAVVGALLIVVEFQIAAWGGAVQSRLEQPNVFELAPMALVCTPDLIFLAAFALVLTAARIANQRNGAARAGALRIRSFLDGLEALGPDWVFCWAVVLGDAAILLQAVYHPRYLCLAVPFLFAALAFGLHAPRRLRGLAAPTLAAIATVNLANQNGSFFPPLPDDLKRSATFLERSREYIENHRALLKAVKTLEREARGRPILVSEFMAHYLTNPGLGFVQKPLRGYTLHPNFPPEILKPFQDFLADKPGEILTIDYQERFRLDFYFTFPPPGPADEVLYRDALHPPVAIRRERFDAAPGEDPHGDFLVRLISPWPAGERALEILDSLGRGDLVEKYRRRPDGGPPAPPRP